MIAVVDASALLGGYFFRFTPLALRNRREYVCATAAAHIASKERYIVPDWCRYFSQQRLSFWS